MTTAKRNSVLLWAVQGLLQGPIVLPLGFLRFIGTAEVAGALGLILPGLLHIQRALTPFAAMGLLVIMSGATAITVQGGAVSPALIPAIAGLLAATVAYGRRGWTPLG